MLRAHYFKIIWYALAWSFHNKLKQKKKFKHIVVEQQNVYLLHILSQHLLDVFLCPFSFFPALSFFALSVNASFPCFLSTVVCLHIASIFFSSLSLSVFFCSFCGCVEYHISCWRHKQRVIDTTIMWTTKKKRRWKKLYRNCGPSTFVTHNKASRP